MLRAVFLGVFALSMLSGCAVIGHWFPKIAPVDASSAVYRAAMADFSMCATTSDPVLRLATAQRLAGAAALLQQEARPTNPDHFYMTDRVSAAAAYCADSLR